MGKKGVAFCRCTVIIQLFPDNAVKLQSNYTITPGETSFALSITNLMFEMTPLQELAITSLLLGPETERRCVDFPITVDPVFA